MCRLHDCPGLDDNQAVTSEHEQFMVEALAQARLARDAGEVPIGAVVVLAGEVVGRGFNGPISRTDPTAHAEIVAIREAATAIGNYRLTGATLYVTIEPCLMCAGAFVHARIGTVVYGAQEPRTGALESTVRAAELPGHNHRVQVLGGILADDCRALMQTFFKERRGGKSGAAQAADSGLPASGSVGSGTAD